MRLVAALVVVFGCTSRSDPPPAPVPVSVPAPAVVPDAAVDAASPPPVAVIDAPPADGEETSAILQEVMRSPPCCCALASTLPEVQTQPRLYCQQDLHGTCVRAVDCPAKGTVAATIEAWFLRTAAGATDLTGFPFDAQIAWDDRCRRPHEIHAADPAGLAAEAECLGPTLAESLPPHRAWKAGWGCPKRPTSDLAKRIQVERSGDTLRCATKKIHAGFDTFGTLGVFVAVRGGKVTALLIEN